MQGLLETAVVLHTCEVFFNRASCLFNRVTDLDFEKLHRAVLICIIVRKFYFIPVKTGLLRCL